MQAENQAQTPVNAVETESRPNGVLILRSPYPIGPVPDSMVQVLLERANEYPDRTLIAEKQGDEWVHLTYAEAVDGCRRVAQWLLDHGAGPDRPVAILTDRSINHFLMAWGAQFARVPYSPVSVSYSTIAGAFPKLEAVLATVDPAFVFAEHLANCRDALERLDLGDAVIITCDAGNGHTPWHEVIATAATDDVDREIAAIDHDTVTRYMFTSGSTGMPKGVIHTQGMACHMMASSAGLRESGDRSVETRVLDWMPWSHVGAGVMRINGMINAAGTIYLDTGKPVPGEFTKTLENIKTARPTQFAGAPLGWSMLVDALEKDDELARIFYENVRAMQSGSAAMPVALANRIKALNRKYTNQDFQFGTSLLSTEVSICLNRYWPTERSDVIGLPAPGAEIKLVPTADKYELRVRSPANTPGYLGLPEKTRESFDEEGFFMMGDAVRFADPNNPSEGLVFAGRVAEEFKLVSGTWVSAGTLRADVVTAASPLVRDVVVCGLNEDFVALLIWPNLNTCQTLAESDDPAVIAGHPAVVNAVREKLVAYNAGNRSSSRFIRRFLLMAEPPDPGAYEITDKGYVNQGAVQTNRKDKVERLFQPAPDADVVDLESV